jgi:3'-phosphoadenosine 5'-phosphosulfate sulfotransferase (PAPS reductase)/FAD synthetase
VGKTGDSAMNVHDCKTFMLWSKNPEYLEKVTETRVAIYEITRKNKCYVAFSGGKDSTVLLHLTLQCQSDVPVFHWDYGIFMPRVFETEIQENAVKLGAKNVMVEQRLSTREDCKFGYQGFFGATHKFMVTKGLEAALIGLRREESNKRKAKIREGRKGECYPLADWTYRDVWAYIVSNGLPYPKVYDIYGPLLGWDKARFVTFFDGEFEKFGSPYLDGFFFPQYRNK